MRQFEQEKSTRTRRAWGVSHPTLQRPAAFLLEVALAMLAQARLLPLTGGFAL